MRRIFSSTLYIEARRVIKVYVNLKNDGCIFHEACVSAEETVEIELLSVNLRKEDGSEKKID